MKINYYHIIPRIIHKLVDKANRSQGLPFVMVSTNLTFRTWRFGYYLQSISLLYAYNHIGTSGRQQKNPRKTYKESRILSYPGNEKLDILWGMSFILQASSKPLDQLDQNQVLYNYIWLIHSGFVFSKPTIPRMSTVILADQCDFEYYIWFYTRTALWL